VTRRRISNLRRFRQLADAQFATGKATMRIHDELIFDKMPTDYALVATYIIVTTLVVIQIMIALIGWRKRNDGPKVRNWLAPQFLISSLAYLLGEAFYYIYSAKIAQEIGEQGGIGGMCGSVCIFVAYSDLTWKKGIFNVAACICVVISILTWAFNRPQKTAS